MAAKVSDELAPFPFARQSPDTPPLEYLTRADGDGLVDVDFRGTPVTLILGHENARRALSCPAFSTDPRISGHPYHSAYQERWFSSGNFIDFDGAEHAAFRRALAPLFSKQAADSSRFAVRATCEQVLEGVASDSDIMSAFAYPVATRTLAAYIGFPEDHSETIDIATRAMIKHLFDPAQLESAQNQLVDVIADWVKTPVSRTAPVCELLIQRGLASREQLVGAVYLLLTAGHQTVASGIGLSLWKLTNSNVLWDRLRTGTLEVSLYVEEVLRFFGIADWVAFDRVATSDVEIGGRTLPAGRGVFVSGLSASRDDSAIENANEFLVAQRKAPNLAFGHGVHKCIGMHVAKVVMEEAVSVFMNQFPDGELQGTASFDLGARTFGPTSLFIEAVEK